MCKHHVSHHESWILVIGYFLIKASIPMIAAIAKDMLYNTATRRLKLSHKYPRKITLMKNDKQ